MSIIVCAVAPIVAASFSSRAGAIKPSSRPKTMYNGYSSDRPSAPGSTPGREAGQAEAGANMASPRPSRRQRPQPRSSRVPHKSVCRQQPRVRARSQRGRRSRAHAERAVLHEGIDAVSCFRNPHFPKDGGCPRTLWQRNRLRGVAILRVRLSCH